MEVLIQVKSEREKSNKLVILLNYTSSIYAILITLISVINIKIIIIINIVRKNRADRIITIKERVLKIQFLKPLYILLGLQEEFSLS